MLDVAVLCLWSVCQDPGVVAWSGDVPELRLGDAFDARRQWHALLEERIGSDATRVESVPDPSASDGEADLDAMVLLVGANGASVEAVRSVSEASLAMVRGARRESRLLLASTLPIDDDSGLRALREWTRLHDEVSWVDLTGPLAGGVDPGELARNPFHHEAIANHLASHLRLQLDPRSIDLADALAKRGTGVTEGAYHGFVRHDFALPGTSVRCTLVEPERAAAGRPWIWRARFFGHEPALDLALLDRGFHLGYCDVADLYGAPAAVARWEEFWTLATTELELSETPILHGLSRGGLPVLEFAIAHPDRASAIVLDNAVCDFRTWPGGRGGERSDADWARLLEAYGLTDAEAFDAPALPIDRLAPLAAAGVPLHVLLGTADDVVPPAGNGEPLAARYAELGAPVTVWRKPGLGHHPHGLHPVDPLVRALLRDTGVDDHNPAAHAVSSVEHRSGAGWGEGGSWWQQVERMRELARTHPDLELAFLGDSISQGLTGAADRVTRDGGTRAVDRFANAISLGLSGDRTEHLLFRIEHGALAEFDPRVIVLNIGVNNLNAARHTGAEVAAGLEAVVEALRTHEPQASVVICGPFPTAHDPADPRREALDAIHARARELGEREHVDHLDLRPLFLDAEGAPNGRMRGDAIHVNDAGRAAWMEAIEPVVRARLSG